MNVSNRQVGLWSKDGARVSVWVHRPLNLAAMDHALGEGGVNNLELDTHLTSDGHVVVWHYPNVDDFTDGHGLIAEMTLDQVRRLRMRRPDVMMNYPGPGGDSIHLGDPSDPLNRIPTLDEVFTRYPSVVCSIDMKRPDAISPTLAVMRSHERNFDIGAAFSDASVRRIRSEHRQLRTAAAQREAIRFFVASRIGRRRRGPQFSMLMPPIRLAPGIATDTRLLRYAKSHDVPVHVWTANEPSVIERMLDFAEKDLLTGFQTDLPLVARFALEAAGWKQTFGRYVDIFGPDPEPPH